MGAWSKEVAMWKEQQYSNLRWKKASMKEVEKQWDTPAFFNGIPLKKQKSGAKPQSFDKYSHIILE